MKLILDEPMPLRAAAQLRNTGLDTQHVIELGMRGATDEAVLARALDLGAAVATYDSDFHQILAETGADKPSVIRVRIEGLDYRALADLLSRVLAVTTPQLETGVAMSVTEQRIRFRSLPIDRL